MSFNDHLKKRIEHLLFLKYSKSFNISEHSVVSGGSINDAYKIKADNTYFFVKVNDALKFPQMFELETRGLQLLSDNSDFKIPETIICSSSENEAILIMEFISPGTKTTAFFNR